jgi:hypothetical protein
MNKNLKQYFEEEKNKSILKPSTFDLENRNNFKRVLNNLNVEKDGVIGSAKNKNILSTYTKYFVALSAPLALAAFSFFFFDFAKLNQNEIDTGEIEKVENLAFNSDSAGQNVAMSARSMINEKVSPAMMSADMSSSASLEAGASVNFYKAEALRVLSELESFDEINYQEI